MNATYIVDSPKKRDRVASLIGKLPEDQVWDVTVKEYEPRRTLEQNARLHLIFSMVAKATGSDIESVKLGYKALFLPGKEADFHGHKVTVYPKTSKMSKKQLRAFMDQVESHAISEHGVLIGDNEYQYT